MAHVRLRALAACAREDQGHRRLSGHTDAGSVAVVSGSELSTVITPWVGVLSHLKGLKSAPQSAIAVDRVWQAQAVVAVVASSRAEAEDAAELVAVDYEELDAVTDMRTALDPATAVIHASLGDNLAFERNHDAGAVDQAFAESDEVVERVRFRRHTGVNSNRARGSRLEHRGSEADHLSSTQAPAYGAKYCGASSRFEGIAGPRVCKDVGGSFGIKVHIYADEMATYALSKLLRRPSNSSPTGSRAFNTDIHAREPSLQGKDRRQARRHYHGIRDRRSHGDRALFDVPRTSAIEANQSSISLVVPI